MPKHRRALLRIHSLFANQTLSPLHGLALLLRTHASRPSSPRPRRRLSLDTRRGLQLRPLKIARNAGTHDPPRMDALYRSLVPSQLFKLLGDAAHLCAHYRAVPHRPRFLWRERLRMPLLNTLLRRKLWRLHGSSSPLIVPQTPTWAWPCRPANYETYPPLQGFTSSTIA